MTLNTMALAMTRVAPSWEPLKGWAVSSGIYTFLMHGDRFVLAETDKVGSLTNCASCFRSQIREYVGDRRSGRMPTK